MAFSSGRAVPTMSAGEGGEGGGGRAGGGFVKREQQFNRTAQEDEPMAELSAQTRMRRRRKSVAVLDWEEVT